MKQKWLYTLLGLFALFSCVNEDEQAITPPKGSAVRFTAEIPGINTPATRSMDGTKENEIQTIDVLVFDSSNQFVERKQGQNITQSGTNNENVNFEAGLSSGTGRSVVVVANARSVISGLTLTAGDSKVSVLQQLQYSQAGKWAADGAGTYTAIPMVGEVTGRTIASGGTITGISLTRMLARIDVKITTTDFTLEKIHLCNYNRNGYIAPTWNGSGTLQSGATTPNLPASPNKNTTTPLSYIPSNQLYEGEIYTFESDSARDASDIDRKNATCLVVEGKYNGTTYFYRIDFTKDDGTKAYMPLLRNYKYVVDITSAAGIGYDTLDEALASYTLPSNLKTRLIYYDMSEVKDLVYNGQYFLGVSNKEIELPRNAQTTTSTDNTLLITTDNPTGWTIEAIRISSGPAGWMTTDRTTGPAGATGTPVKLLMGANMLGTDRVAEIDLRAGRLTYTVKVTQTNKAKLTIQVMDGTGTAPITELVFAAAADVQPAAQSFQLQWEPSDLSVATLQTPIGSTGGVTLTPAIPTAITDPTGRKTFTVCPATAITTANLNSDPFYERNTSVDFTLTEGGDSKTGTLLLRQYVYNLMADIRSYYQIGNKTYTFKVKSNCNWTITAVTEHRSSGTGNLLANTGSDNLAVGTTGGYDITTGKTISFTTGSATGNPKGTVDVTFTSQEFGPKTITLNIMGEYYPPRHKGWAGSNIYWDGTKMTFDDTDDTSHEQYSGLHFQWGSLWGIDPSGANNSAWDSSKIIYKPDGTTATGVAWAGIPRVSNINITSTPPAGKTLRDRHYLYEIHGGAVGVGDICREITERNGGTLHGKKWRMPTSLEFEAAASYIQSGPFAVASSNASGTVAIPSGYKKTDTGTPFFPAVGMRATNGQLAHVGYSGAYWSGSPFDTFAYHLDYNSGGVGSGSRTTRVPGFSVRCVQE